VQDPVGWSVLSGNTGGFLRKWFNDPSVPLFGVGVMLSKPVNNRRNQRKWLIRER